MVTETINTPRYLYLKKNLCALALVRLERVVEINRQEINEQELRSEIINEIRAIKEDFTIPANTLKQDTSITDMEEIEQGLKWIIDSKHDAKISPFYHQKYNTPVTKKDIYHLPNLEGSYLFIKERFREKNALYTGARKNIAKIMDHCDFLMNTITAYAQAENTTIHLSETIMYSNILETIDSIFSLSEAGERGIEHV